MGTETGRWASPPAPLRHPRPCQPCAPSTGEGVPLPLRPLPPCRYNRLLPSSSPPPLLMLICGLERTADVAPLFWLASKKQGLEAQAREIDGEFVVLVGSDAAKDWTSKSNHSYSRRHAQLIKSGKLVPGDKGRRRFADDVAFRSPSAASAVILGRPDNGRVSWKVDGSTVTYGDWQSEQAAKASSEASNADDDGEAVG